MKYELKDLISFSKGLLKFAFIYIKLVFRYKSFKKAHHSIMIMYKIIKLHMGENGKLTVK